MDERRIKEFSASISAEVSNKIYYEFLLARHLPEIFAIEKGKLKALRGREAKGYIKEKIRLLGK